MPNKLPSLDTVAQTLRAFVRREVTVTPAARTGAGLLPLGGLYHDGQQRPVAACLSDVGFAAASSAAFALIPARVAAESATAKRLDESLAEIFAEVLNVLSRLFTSHDDARVTLAAKFLPPQALPAELASLGPDQCLDLDVEIDGYGTGRLVLCALPS
ncbi:MAG: hypothetical protein VW625_01895 [Perlucidibaca sp.]